MHTTMRRLSKLNIVIAIVLIVISSVFVSNVFAATTEIQPNDSQYLELRAVSVDDVAGQNKQVIMELWSHDLDFKGFEVTFEYDSTKFNPSNINTNVITDDETEFFKFEPEFSGKLDIFSVPGSSNNVLDLTVSLNTPISAETSNIKEDGNGGYQVATKGKDILLGKLSFQMPSNKEFSIDGFGLVTNSYTPQTGIKIDISLTQNYQKQSTFRFTDETASRNANLTNIIVSSGEVDELDPTNSTYKEYALTPTFDKENLNYTMSFEEYLDQLDIKAIVEDDTATMVIKVPKRDEDDKLVKVGDVIQYEEKTLDSGTPLEVNINKLGEPDTILTILVTAEDGTTTKEYTVTIHRPFASITGTVILGDGLRESIDDSYGIYVKYLSNCTLYKAGLYDWDGIIYGTFALDELNDEKYETRVVTNEDDGSYTMYVVPGTYDLLIEKLGFLADITTNITLTEGQEIDLGSKTLIEGDVDRSGIIDLDDIVALVDVMDAVKDDGVYEEYYDFGNKEFVSLDDLVSAVTNCDALVTVNPY